MPKFSPQDVARTMIQRLRSAHSGCEWLASQQSVPINTLVSRIMGVQSSIDGAHEALQILQGSFSNAVIASRISDHLEPAPADLAAAYVAARTAVNAMLDGYGATVLPVLPFPYTFDPVLRRHDEASYNIDTPVNFKTNLIAARDALEVFA